MTKVNRKRYKKISEMVRDLTRDEVIAKELEEQIGKRGLVRALARLRNAKSVSQEQIAQCLSCKQSRISKLENGFDADLSIGDLIGYAQALECDLGIILKSRELSPVDEIKLHAAGIKNCLDKLNALVKDDAKIAKGVAKFHLEALINLVSIITKSAKQLVDHGRPTDEPEVCLELREPNALGTDPLSSETCQPGTHAELAEV